MPMPETSDYLSNYDGHLCDIENCIIRTSLKLHTFGRRFYTCRYWSLCMQVFQVDRHQHLLYAWRSNNTYCYHQIQVIGACGGSCQ
ncbi:hypothetical protein ACJW31_05G017600 [Castanea mollissima]